MTTNKLRLSRWFARNTKQQNEIRRRQKRHAVRPMLELLEDRRMLAVSVLNSASSTGNNATTETIPSFNVPAGNDLALVVVGSGYGLFNSVNNFGGESFSFVQGEGSALSGGFGSVDASVWIALLGDRGSPTIADVVSNWSVDGSNQWKRISAIALSGVDQMAPTSGAMGNDTFSDPHTLNISSQIGDLVVDAITTGFAGGGTANPPTVGGGQTSLFSATAVGVDTTPSSSLVGLGLAASHEPGAATTAMSWSNFGGANRLAHVAVNIVQAAATATNTTVSISAGELTINDDDGGDNDYTLSLSGGTYTLTDPGNTIDVSGIPGSTGSGTDMVTFPAASITSIVIEGNAGDDNLTVDFGGGDPVPSGGLTFNGGGQTNGDALDLVSVSGAFPTHTYNYTNANDGSIVLNDGSSDSTITYTGLEPISNDGTATDVIFNLPSAAPNTDVVLAAAGAGMNQLTASTFENTTFANPTAGGSLTINGGTMADTISVQALDGALDADLTVDGGGATDSITFTSGPVDLGTGSLSSTAETTNLATNLQTDGGDVAITGGNVVLTSSVTIDTEMGNDDDAGDVDFTGATLIESNAKGRDLTIDASTGSGSGGNVTLITINGSGVNKPNDLMVDSRGTTDGVISLTGDITLNDDGAGNAANATLSGDVRITVTRSISTNDMTSGGGAIDLQNATVSATGAGLNLTLSTSNTGGTSDNDITLGVFNATGGSLVADLTADAGSSGDVMVTDEITLSGNLSATANAIDLGADVTSAIDQSYTGPVTLSAPVTLTADDISLIGTVDNGGNLLTIDVGGTSSAANFAISGAGGLTKDGSGTFSLGGASTYDGATTVADGTLSVAGSLDMGAPVTVQNGGTLAGTGTIGRPISVQSGGTLSPGTSPGALSTGNLTLASGSSFDVEAQAPFMTAGTDYDQLDVTGTVDLTGSTLSFTATGAPTDSRLLTLISNDGGDAVTGTFAGLPEGATVTSGSFSGTISYIGGDGNDVAIVTQGAWNIVGSAGGDVFVLRRANVGGVDQIQLLDGSMTVIDSRPLSAVTEVVVDGMAGDDMLTVDFGGGNPVPMGGLTFNGGGQATSAGDVLNITGNATPFSSFTVNHTGSGPDGFNGNVDIAGSGAISYTGLEPINAGNATNIVFNLPAANDVMTLADAGGGQFTLDVTSGTAETVTMNYPAPGGSLTINTGDGNDTLTVTNTLLFNAGTALTINGQGSTTGDVINLNAAGGFNVTGNLALTAETIAQTGAFTVAGTTTLDAGAGGTITLNNAANNFSGAVSVPSANNVALRDANALNLGASTIGTMFVITHGGPLTDSGNLSVAGTTTINGGSSLVTLDQAGNNFGTAFVSTTNNVTLVDANALDLGASNIGGTLNVTVGGALTDSGALVVTGTTTITAGANNVTLNEAGNDFSLLGITSANNVVLVDSNLLGLAASTIGGTLNVTTSGSITDTGNLVVTGATTLSAGAANNINLNDSNNFSTVSVVSGNNVTLVDTNGLDLGASTISGTLNVTPGGPLTDSGNLAVTGTTTITAGSSNVTLNNAGNNFSRVDVVSANNVVLVDANALALGPAMIGGTLNVTTSGALTDDGNLLVTGATTLTAGAGNITFDQTGNNFSTVVITSANHAAIDDANGIVFGAVTTTGDFTVDAGGNVTLGGAASVGGNVDIQSDANAPNGSIDVNAKLTATGTVTLDADDNVTINAAIDPTVVNLNSDDDVIVNAAVVASMAININAGQNDGTGSATVSGTGSLTTTDAGSDVTINTGATTGAITLAGNVTAVDRLTLNSPGAGDVMQSGGALTAANLLATGVAAVTLNQAGNNVDTVAADLNPGSFSLTDADDVAVGTVGAVNGIATGNGGNGGAVTINATAGTITVGQPIDTTPGTGGGISISGSVVLNGALTAGGGTITLNGNNAGAVDIVINQPLSSDGPISLAAPRDILVGALVQTTGAGSDVTLTADTDADMIGGVQVQAAGVVDSANDATLTGSNLFVTAGPVDSVDIQAGGTVTATMNVLIQDGANAPVGTDTVVAGMVTSSAGTVTINALDEAAVSAAVMAMGNVVVTGASINHSAGTITSTAGGVALTSNTGTGNIVVNNVVANANTVNGNTDAIKIDTATGNVTINGTLTATGMPGLNIDVDPVDVNINAAMTATGDIDVTASNNININGGGSVSAGQNVNIAAGGSVLVDGTIDSDNTGGGRMIGLTAGVDVDVNAVVTSSGGAITVLADNDVSFGAAGSLDTEVGGTSTIALTADDDGVGGGGIDMTDGSFADAWGGNLDVLATDNINISLLRSSAVITVESTSGAITDADGGAGLDINRAGAAALRAATGIGSGAALETDLMTLAASNTTGGNIEIDDVGANANVLTIGTVDLLVGVTNMAAGGTVVISNASPMNVAADVSSVGDVTLTAGETAAAGDDLTVDPGVTITSMAGNILLEAGDNFGLPAGTTYVATSGTVTATSIDTAVDVPSSMFDVAGDFDATSATFNGSTIDDAANGDVFNITPDQDTGDVLTPFFVNGNDPTTAPGDMMTVDVTGLLDVTLTIGQNPNDGRYDFSNAASVTFDSIETVDTTPAGVPVNLIVDLGDPAFNPAPDGMTNRLEVQLNAAGDQLEIFFSNGGGPLVPVLTGDDNPINSLTVLGTTDPDTLVFNTNASGQLPTEGGGFAGVGALPTPRKPLSAAFLASGRTPNMPDPPVVYFDGGTGAASDGIEFNFTASGATVDRDVAYFSDSNLSFAVNNGDINIAPAAGPLVGFTMTFADLTPINFIGAGGSLLVDATSTPATTTLSIDDDGMAMDGVSMITGDGGFETTTFSGFDSLNVRGGAGDELVDLAALDDTTTTTAVTIDGDNTTDDDTGNDTLQVRSTPPGVAVTMLGGLGSDNFWIFNQNTGASPANTVDGIEGTVTVSPTGLDNVPAGGDVDSLLIVDRADVAGGGDVVTINSTTIDGLFDMGMGTDVTYNPDQLDNVTLIASGEGDTLNLDFMGLGGSDLDAVTINGSGGRDLFVLMNDTAPGVTTTLDGDEDIAGAPNTGANDDLLDISPLTSPRTVFLTGHGAIDGYTGTEAAIQGPGSTFTNIDAVQAPAGGGDTLVMDIVSDATHWDLGGMVSGFGPFGAMMSVTLMDSLTNTGVLVSDETDLAGTGNASVIGLPEAGRAGPPQFPPFPALPNPIEPTPATAEDDLAWAGFENLTGASMADDRFDFRDGAAITGVIDGRGSDVNGDSIDYRDFTTAVVVDLAAGTSTNIGGGLAIGTGGPLDGSSIENVFGGNDDDHLTGDQDNNILGDGHGSDSLDGGAVMVGPDMVSGNDTFRLEPGLNEDGTGDSSDVITDLNNVVPNGGDTVDFRFADHRVMIDMDLLDVPQDALFQTPGDQFVTLLRRAEHDPLGPSMFENVVGSQFNDIIDLDPLTVDGNAPHSGPPTLRSVDGNDPFVGGPDDGNLPDPADPIPPGDEWHFNAGGRAVQDTGFSISAAGLGTVLYASIETLKTFNVLPRYIDDGDDPFTESPTHAQSNISFFANWNIVDSESGLGGDFRFNHADTASGEVGGNHTATWSFFGVTPGMYRISVSFPDPAISPQLNDVASDAEYTIRDDDRIIARVDVDQQTGADDFLDQGVWWEDLGVFDIRSHSLLVRLRDRADGIVLADAVRIERVNVMPEGAGSLVAPSTGGEITVLDGSQLILDDSSLVAMTTNVDNPLVKTFVIRNDGDGPLRIDDIALEPDPGMPATNYTLVKPNGDDGLTPINPMANPLTIAPGQVTFFTLTLNATTMNEQGDFAGQIRIFSNDFDENVVQKPGTTGIADPTDMNVPPNDVDPFTFEVRGVVTNQTIIDNGDNDFSVVGIWTAAATGFEGDELWTPADDSGDRARWEFTGLPDGVYRVSATWQGISGIMASTQSPFTVANTGGVINSVMIDQTVAPNDFSDAGVMWEDLGGPITLTGGTIVVNLLDTAGQPSRNVLADAIRIERLYSNAATTPPFVTTLPDIEVEVDMTDVADDTGSVDFGDTWPGTPIEKTFTIRNVGGASLTVEQPVSLPAGYTLVSFDGVMGPDGVTPAMIAPAGMTTMVVRMEAGLPGELPGEIWFATNDPDENTFNFEVTGNNRSSQLIDDQDGAPGFTNTAGFTLFTNNNQGFNSQIHVATVDSSGDTATWTFDGLTPGRQYQVSASWTPNGSRAPDAAYSVSGVTAPATVTVDQRVLPSQRRTNGHTFDDLGIFTADGSGTLVVTLSDVASSGDVVADVVRVAAIEQPELQVEDTTGGGAVLLDGGGTVDFGSTPVGTPLMHTITLVNQGSRPLTLGPVSLPAGFSVVGAFPTSVPTGGSIPVMLQFDAAAAGAFGGIMQFAADELDENPFEVTLNADAFTVSTQIVDDGGVGFMSTAPFTPMAGGFLGDYQQAAVSPPAAAGAATWTFTVNPMTQYRISATWVAAANRATNATFSFGGVMTGPTSSIENQRVAPNDFSDAGAAWEDLALITTDGSSTLTVTLPNDTVALNGLVIADAVRIEELLIINNEDPAPQYSSIGDFFTSNGQGRRNSMQFAADNGPASTATFTFDNLPAGATYRVSATWPESGNRATDAPFTVSGVEGGPFSVDINQELASGDYAAEGSLWEDLGGPYTVVDAGGGMGSITVTLTNVGANENVIADAVRLQPLPAQPEITVEDSGMAAVLDGGTFNFTPTAVGTPVAETFTVTNHGSATLVLDNASLTSALDQLNQFELVSGFSSTMLAPGATATFTLRMLADQPGSPAATIQFGTNDVGENPFDITLAGTVVTPSLLIDDGDAAYTEGGSNLPLPDFTGQGFMNDVRQIAANSDNTASYTFTGLTAMTTYRVAATWTVGMSRSNAAPLTVMGALGGDVDFGINQQVAPNDITVSGTQFDVIGLFRTTGTTLTVEWAAATSGVVIADAVQLVEVLAPGPEIQVTGSPDVADGGTVDVGSIGQGGMLSKTFTITNQGSSALDIGAIMVSGDFTLAAPPPVLPATIPADGAPLTFTVDLVTATTGAKAGVVTIDSNDISENPFTINLTADVADATTIIDNGDAGYMDTGFQVFGGQGFMNDVAQSAANAGNTATWTFSGLDPAGVYQVAATWTAFGNRAANAPYTVMGGSAQMFSVNQKVAPASFSDSGVNWQTLGGSFAPDGSNEITVTLGDTGANGFVIADAVRLERLFGPEIEVSQGATPIIDGTTVLDFGQALIGSTFRRTFSIENVGAAPLDVASVLTLPAGFTLVPAADPNDPPMPATLFDGSMMDTVIASGGAGTFTVEVDTTVAASFSGSLSFGNNDANEAPFNFTIEADVVASLIIDNDTPGYMQTAGFQFFGGQGFNNNVRAEFSPNGGDTATWTFTGLPAGMYRVSATWSPFSNRATNAPFNIDSGMGVGMAGPIAVNQKLAPSNPLAVMGVGTSVMDSGGTFADLMDPYNHTGGDLVVTLDDTAVNGWIIADAIRIAPMGMLLADDIAPADYAHLDRASLLTGGPSAARAGAFSAAAQPPALTSQDVGPLLAKAVDYWTGIDPSAAARLEHIEVIVRDLPTSILGLGSYASPRILLDADAAGRGWSLDAAGSATALSNPSRVDLLSVVTHELGHVLGHPDLDPVSHPTHIMSGILPTGLSRVPTLAAAPTFAAARAISPLAGDTIFARFEASDPFGFDTSIAKDASDANDDEPTSLIAALPSRSSTSDPEESHRDRARADIFARWEDDDATNLETLIPGAAEDADGVGAT